MTSKTRGSGGIDLWTRVENEPIETSEEGSESTTLFVGDSGCGKSSLIQSFIKPTGTKEPKPTFALDYNYARRKAGSSAPGSKSVAHLWELGGDISEPKLLEVPLTVKNLSSAAVVVVCDLSKPQNCLASLLKWIVTVRAVIKQRFGDLQSTNSGAATGLKENAVAQFRELAPEPDAARSRPCEIPLYIVANKYDTFKNNSNRRTLMQIIRFVAHFHGASVITASSADAVLKESFRSTMNAICFRTSNKSVYDASVDKAVQISAGRDSFESILLGTVRDGDSSAGGKSRLANSESDFSMYLSSSSVTRDCWDRMSEILSGLLGPPDPSAVKDRGGADDEGEGKDQQNEYPEAEIDEVRAQRDAALQRYIVEAECRDAMMAKLNAKVSSERSEAKAERDEPAEVPVAADVPKRRSKK